MPTPKIKATYSLDPGTVAKLEELARIWDTSKSEALRRAIQECSLPDEKGSKADAKQRLAAFHRLQRSMALTPANAEGWVRQVQEERRAWTKRIGR